MPITAATVTNTLANQSGTIQLSLLDTNYTNILTFLNTTLNYSNYLVDSGIADAYVVTFSGGLTFTLTAGQIIYMKVGFANTGACTLAVNGGAAKSIKTQASADPGNGVLAAGGIYGLIYSGTVWQIL